MSQVTKFAVEELYELSSSNAGGGITFYMSFFEIYGGKVMDLLNGKRNFKFLKTNFSEFRYKVLKRRKLELHRICLTLLTSVIVFVLLIKRLLMTHLADLMLSVK